jgi:hypothetical protein
MIKSPTTAATSLRHEPLDHVTDDQLEFWRSVTDTFGVGFGAVDEALIGLEPLTVLDLLLPGRSAEERSEVMWALGEFERRSRAAGPSSAPRACVSVCHPAA